MKIPFTNWEINFKQPVAQPVQELAKKEEKEKTLPITPKSSERSSEPEALSLLGMIEQELALVEPDFDIRLLEALEHFAKYNADLSYAVDNIVQLGNTEYVRFFGSDVSDELSKQMIAHLKSRENNWYGYSDGINGLNNDLFAQAGLMGCISSEMIPNNSLDGLGKVVLVHPKSIRFVYDLKLDVYLPYQVIDSINKFGIDKGVQGLTPLNPITYKYLAIRRFNERPYAIAPFFAALDSIAIEKDMMCNFRNIIRRVGAFGFLEVLVDQPTVLPGENPQAYERRVQAYLNSVVPEADKALGKGYVVGLKGKHDFELKAAPTNPSGAKELFDLNSQTKMAGLKQDPIMLGRNFSTTETIGRVMLTKLGSSIANYQRLVASFRVQMDKMELLLAGFPAEAVNKIEGKFNPPMISDEVKEEQARQLKIANENSLYIQGVISQQTRAQNLGYEEPDEEEPRLPVNPTPDPATAKGGSDPSNKGADVSENSGVLEDTILFSNNVSALVHFFGRDLGEHFEEFDYFCGSDCDHNHSLMEQWEEGSDSSFIKLLEKYFKQYFLATSKVYNKSVDKTTKKIANILSKMSPNTPVGEVTDKILASLYTNWREDFIGPQKKVIGKWITEAYKAFRQDKSMFGGAKQVTLKDGRVVPIPDSIFSVTDFRTIDFYKRNDTLYMGKFITDADTKKKLTQFIKDNYVSGKLPVGSKEKNALDLFREEFGDLLKGEDWKIQRIINTTVNKMKNQASIEYMQQAGVERFKIVGVRDSLQCLWCASMQGRTFEVSLEANRVEKRMQSEPELVKQDSAFMTSVIKREKGITDAEFSRRLTSLNDNQIQDLGVALPPYHSNCRDVVVADL